MDTDDHLELLMTGPVLETREGARGRIAALGLGDRWRLAFHFGLVVRDLEEDLARRLHKPRRRRRKKDLKDERDVNDATRKT